MADSRRLTFHRAFIAIIRLQVRGCGLARLIRRARFCALRFVTANSMAAFLVTAFHPSFLSHLARDPINRPNDKAVAISPLNSSDDSLSIIMIYETGHGKRVSAVLTIASLRRFRKNNFKIFLRTHFLYFSSGANGQIVQLFKRYFIRRLFN